MVAGALASAGYFMGEHLLPPDGGNPKGYFEDWEVNQINDTLIGQVIPARWPSVLGDLFTPARVPRLQRWLAALPVEAALPLPMPVERRIQAVTGRQPFCFKDPRFCYTLPLWRKHVGEAVFVCVFRHPAVTAHSILKECERDPQLRHFRFGFPQAVAVWQSMYTYLLDIHCLAGGEWVFIHYDQFLDGSAVSKLETALAARVDRQFADPQLKRSTEGGLVPPATAALYARLCERAGHHG
jgi:hypothetical protein